ncbi:MULTISPECIES: efflux RND transporter periplasmic adaptor subunit [Thalassotalea]|uniref:efflux RND transporter periplasmic adaptor subunit n=1 Tax=Thalassotalea TaxID=1518149 RepID=UPI000943635A|nr:MULTISPECIES: efflux RND transporter periplasmic adaptor subunit [Thalassotalea]OKY24877.1 efflux transporter periplasmic adaptor subunit [Thalassotalea sp. PP2-459]
MTRKKQIILPIVILLVGAVIFFALSSMKKPPEEKPKVDNTPIVAVEEISVAPLTLTVESYGVVTPKYEIELVAQVSGQIVELSDKFVRGGFVTKGQILARIDPSDYQAALIDAQANLASATASLQEEVARGKVAEEEWKRIQNASPTALSLRKPQLAQEKARVKAAKASVLRAERNLERTYLKAPFDAMIESRHIGLGAFVATGSNIGKMLGTETAEIRLPVADNQLQFLVNQGEAATVNLEGEFSGQKQVWQASIARGEGVIDDTSRMSYLVAEVVDPYGLKATSDVIPLRFGSYVNAKVLGKELAMATSVPRHLVNKDRVALLNQDSTLTFANIEIVSQDGSNVIVSSGLKTGDRMIISALDYPIEGMKLSLAGEDVDLPETDVNEDAQIASVKD